MGDIHAGGPTEVPVSLAVKLASLVVHAQEVQETADDTWADLAAMGALAMDTEVLAWLDSFDPALLPVKRHG